MTSQAKKIIIYCTIFISITGFFFLFYQKKLVKNSVATEAKMDLEHNPTQPFEMKITNSNYSNAFRITYILDQNELKIILQGELEGEKDTVIFRKKLQPNQNLRKLAAIKLDSLKSYYENPCYRDGSQIIVQIKKDNIEKQIQLSNFYQSDIGIAIELINKLVLKKHIIWYDKKILMQGMLDCK